jgi:tungstate transport system ATP-binding protein
MAMVFQNPSLFQRTVEANIAYALKIRFMNPDRINEEVFKALNLVGLESYKHQFAPTLSAGEAQRVSFARAIVFEPELLLLDEFTANLDPANVKLLEEGVINYHRDTNATIVLATHNLFQAKRLAHEVIFIFDGEIVERAEKEEFFSNPEDKLTKSFLSGELIC